MYLSNWQYDKANEMTEGTTVNPSTSWNYDSLIRIS